jgi:predicted acetyltransferase
LATFENGRMAAHLVVYGWQMALNGGTVPLGGIGDVAVWPEDRRGGQARALLRVCLASMRDRGLSLSMLHPSFYALYDRFGWAQAAESRTYVFRSVDLRFRTAAPAAGRLERISAADWPVLAEIYGRWLPQANGAIVRTTEQWTVRVLRAPGPTQPRQLVVWRDGAGEAQGYLVHRYPVRGSDSAALYDQEIAVQELVALTPAAYRALIEYLSRHDLAGRVRLRLPPDDPFLSLLADPSPVTVETRPDIMLRLVDLVPALEGRAYLPGAAARLALRVADPVAPWNNGVWRVEVEGGRARVTATTAEPDLATDAGTLASLYNGFLTPQRAHRAGLLEAHDAEAVGAMERIFAVCAPPFCLDYF